MKNIYLSFLMCTFFFAASLNTYVYGLEAGDFNRDGRVDEFEKRLLKGSRSIAPRQISKTPIEITLDYAKEKGVFSKFLFMVTDAPGASEEAYSLAKEANFKVMNEIHFLTEPREMEKKGALLSKYSMEGVVFLQIEIHHYLKEAEIMKISDRMLETIEALKQRHPGLEIKTFLFANEPDLLLPSGIAAPIFWEGTKEQLFENYAMFAKYLKSQDPAYVVGGLGFASAVLPEGQEWIKKFLEYVDEHKVPLDFIAFHGYSYEINHTYLQGIRFIQGLLERYGHLSPVFGQPKIAVTELDIEALLIPGKEEYPQMHTMWRAAHNVMAMMGLVDQGLWMGCEFGGPFIDGDNIANFLWIKPDRTIKPVYYGWKAFNNLADTVRIAQSGSNFETFGVAAGKSNAGDTLIIVIASYDRDAFLSQCIARATPVPLPFLPEEQYSFKVFKSYSLALINLPWAPSDTVTMERYIVDDSHRLELEEISELYGNDHITISRDIQLPQVQLIKIYRKKG